MKILCFTTEINRNAPNIKSRAVKATLAIGFHPPNKEKTELFLIHFTPKNQTGYRYKVRDNIQRIYTKFINDGKITISFKNPEIDLLIKCDPLQLKCFLRTMKSVLHGNENIQKIGLSTLATTSISQKLHPVKKLIIKKISDYPVKGFPKTLKELHIVGIKSNKFSSQIINLKNLTVLNLSENLIELIPKELGNLGLIDLNVSTNKLGKNEFNWLNGKQIRKTLKSINLSNNLITNFPYNLVKCVNLITINLNNNRIKSIPFAIRRLKNLRNFYLDSNKLESLPHTINLLKLDVLGIWNNSFKNSINSYAQMNDKIQFERKIQSLVVLAGQVVVNKRIPYSPSKIPLNLCDFMSEMPLCCCGQLCTFDDVNIIKTASLLFPNVKSLIFERDLCVYADAVICSEKCFKRYINN